MPDKEDDAINDPEVKEAVDEFLLKAAEGMLIIDRGIQAAIIGTPFDNDAFRKIMEVMRGIGRVEGACVLYPIVIPRLDDAGMAAVEEALFKLDDEVKFAQG